MVLEYLTYSSVSHASFPCALCAWPWKVSFERVPDRLGGFVSFELHRRGERSASWCRLRYRCHARTGGIGLIFYTPTYYYAHGRYRYHTCAARGGGSVGTSNHKCPGFPECAVCRAISRQHFTTNKLLVLIIGTGSI